MKMMKSLIQRVMQYGRQIQFQISDNYKNFKRSTVQRKFVLISTPTYGNLGDQALVLAEQKFIEEMISPDYFEFTEEEYFKGRKIIGRFLYQKDILFINGGGFIGTLWKYAEDNFISILNNFSNNRIVVFPQTVFFESSDYGLSERERVKSAINICKNIKIFLRDRESYRIMTEDLGISENICFLVPDIVTFLNVKLDNLRSDKVLFCLRKDLEKVSDSKKFMEIRNYLHQLGKEVADTDTVIEKTLKKEERWEYVQEKLQEFSSSALVITDRVHGMLFAAIAGTPCIAVDNISKKVSGVFEWIKYLDYIQFVNEKELNMELLQRMLKKVDCKYSNTELQKYYDLMKREILDET